MIQNRNRFYPQATIWPQTPSITGCAETQMRSFGLHLQSEMRITGKVIIVEAETLPDS